MAVQAAEARAVGDEAADHRDALVVVVLRDRIDQAGRHARIDLADVARLGAVRAEEELAFLVAPAVVAAAVTMSISSTSFCPTSPT